MEPTWTVCLLGGPSGTGKTTISYRLAAHLGVGLTEVDGLHIVVEYLTTPDQQPMLHYWKTHPEAANLPPERILELHLAVTEVLIPPLVAVVANHIETNTPIVLEGDYIVPALVQRCVTQFGREHITSTFLVEHDQGPLVQNFSSREPKAGTQTKRAQVSQIYGRWIKEEAERLGLPVVEEHPWETVFERVCSAVCPRLSPP